MGTIHHLHLESQELDDNAIQEEKLEGLDITGILDFYDKDTETLIDYKNTGSFKASKVLGMTHVMMPDPSGATYKKSGSWGAKGTFKQVKVFERNENLADFGDWLYQVNMYRYLLELKGHKVKAMKLQMNIRDAGTFTAIARGVDKNIYFVNIPVVDNDEIVSYFTAKRDELLKHLNSNTTPPKCTNEETWQGKKCEKYCEVRTLCPYIKEFKCLQKLSVFATLNDINVNEFKEKKGNYDYLSWSDALQLVLNNYPDTIWETHEFDHPGVDELEDGLKPHT